MKTIIAGILVSAAVLVAACSPGDGEGENAPPPAEHVWQDQVDTVKKAEDVEEVLQDAEQRQRKVIDGQSP